MRTVLVAVVVITSLGLDLAFRTGSAVAVAQGTLQPCGGGIAVRTDGSVLVDAWQSWTASAMQANPTLGKSLPDSRQNPTAITLGQSLGDDVRICVESSDGSKCVALGSLRKK